MPRPLSTEKQKEVEALLAGGSTVAAVMKATGVAKTTVYRIKGEMDDAPRGDARLAVIDVEATVEGEEPTPDAVAETLAYYEGRVAELNELIVDLTLENVRLRRAAGGA